jgi:Rieske Fe-S protein
MALSRREFIAGAAVCVYAINGGCSAVNSAPLYDANADNTVPIPKELAEVGSQVKIKLAGGETTVLVWKTKGGYNGVSIKCMHRGSEVHYNTKADTLDCPQHGSRYRADGSVLEGPTEKGLKSYLVEAQGDRLRIVG